MPSVPVQMEWLAAVQGPQASVRTHDCHIAINLFTYSRKGEKLVKEAEFPSSF